MGENVFFTANNAVHGTELWKSNGTPAGTVMVKDINPLSASSGPRNLFTHNNAIFFNANDGATARFWQSDGTAEGTIKLADGAFKKINEVAGHAFLTRPREEYVPSNSGNGLYILGTPTTPHTIAGRVTTSNGSGLAGVTVSDGTRTATTNASGDYTLTGVSAGSYTLVPALADYSFSPNSRSVSISANLAAQDFTATPLEPQGEELVQSLTPSEGLNNQATAVTVRGNGFATNTPPIARLLSTAGVFALTDVAAETTTRFSANVPAGLEPGLYDLIVTSNGRTGILPNAFMVLSPSADPFISTVVPDAGFNDRPVEVVIQGANFDVGAAVYLGETMLNSSRLSSRSLMAVVPAGVAPGSYSLRVTNGDGKQVVLANGYTVLDAASELNDDLLSNSDYLWLDPVLPRVNHPVQLGLLVERMGGKNTLEAVEVLFRRDAADGPELGRGVVNFLDPRSMESTTPITVTFDATGEVTIYAIIDPDGVIAEHNEQNNIVQRTIIVAPAGNDQVPPVVEQIRINGGAEAAVTAAQINVDVRASDPAPGSGVGHVNIIEYIYSDSIKRWVAIERSAWLPYLTTPANYRWTLQPLAGMRYIQVRARDGAGNISVGQARRLVNYIVSNDRIARDQTRVYRYMLDPGQAFEVNLEVLEGDADLYVWSSQADQSAWVSNQSGSVNEQVRITADQVVPGLYQVEVYGYSAASYRLTTNIGASVANAASLANGGIDPSKTQPTMPVVPLSSIPSEHMGNLPVAVPELEQPATGNMVYLPLVRR
ncbi:ELWxxDGT repeat protein [Candidatus Viridilinea mediisalina]|nr:ELWxxDGT repeat protein [Candidatus Viridilinea mediisalina]